MARAAPSPRSAPPTRSSKRRKTDGDSTKTEETVKDNTKDVKEEKDKGEEGNMQVKAEDEVMEETKPKVEDDEQEEMKPSSKRKSRASNGAAKQEDSKPTTPAKRSSREIKGDVDTTKIETVDKEIGELTEKVSSRSTGSTTTKTPTKNKYNLTPGQTPFPDYPHPTAEECQNVIDLLSSVHGKPEREMAPPSTTVAGCGNVPAVLDSLMRTMLSAATTSANSSRAFQNIVTKYGLLTTGIGKGSVDWDKVRLGSQHELFLTIQCGGLAANKSKNIKTVLDMVHVENQERRSAILDEKDESKPTQSKDTNTPSGIKTETSEQKSDEVETADENVLSLDYLHSLSTEEAMTKLTSYPGVGVKTASCVLLFNFGRGSFAVDTHVWRLCRWLGWVPNHASRNQTYSHCEVRIPDDMKYDLHALFWKHGKYW
jgi:endonuclease III